MSIVAELETVLGGFDLKQPFNAPLYPDCRWGDFRGLSNWRWPPFGRQMMVSLSTTNTIGLVYVLSNPGMPHKMKIYSS